MKTGFIKNVSKYIYIFLAFVALSFSSCGNDNSTKTDDSNIKVALLIPGTLGDKSFFDSANAGMTMIKDEFNCETKVVEMGTDNSKFSSIIEDVIDEKFDIIITGGINISQPLQEMAEKYPNQKFMLYDETVDFSNGQNSNIYCMTYRSNEGAYLAGALAALSTKQGSMPNSNDKNIIGFAGGFDIPLINNWLVGYIEGAKYVDKDIKVAVSYISSFTDAAKGKEIGIALYNLGADVVFQAAGGAGLGCLDAAKEKNLYAIGTDSDQSELFKNDEDKANAILASILKRVDISIKMAITDYKNGDLKFGTEKSYGLKEGCIQITDNEWYNKNVSTEIRNKISDINKDIADGKIVVKDAFSMTEKELQDLKNSVKP